MDNICINKEAVFVDQKRTYIAAAATLLRFSSNSSLPLPNIDLISFKSFLYQTDLAFLTSVQTYQ